MRKLLLASALLLGLSIARPAAAEAGFFFSFSQPGFGIAVGAPYPPARVLPTAAGRVRPAAGRLRGLLPVHHHHPHWGHRGHAWGHGHRGRGHRWR